MEGSEYFKQFNPHEKVHFSREDHKGWLNKNSPGLSILKEYINKHNLKEVMDKEKPFDAHLGWKCTRIVELTTQDPNFHQRYKEIISDTFSTCTLY